jgi:hypothetical protein
MTGDGAEGVSFVSYVLDLFELYDCSPYQQLNYSSMDVFNWAYPLSFSRFSVQTPYPDPLPPDLPVEQAIRGQKSL